MNSFPSRSRLYSMFAILCTIVVFLGVTTLSAQAEESNFFRGRLLTTKYNHDDNSYLVSAISGKGDVLIGRVLNDHSGIKLYQKTTYDSKKGKDGKGAWLSSQTITNPESNLNEVATQQIRDLRISTSQGRTSATRNDFYVSWIVAYYNSDGLFLGERLYIYDVDAISGLDRRIDSIFYYRNPIVPHVQAKQAGELYYELIPTGNAFRLIMINGSDVYVGMYVGFANGDWIPRPMKKVNMDGTKYKASIRYGRYILLQTGDHVEQYSITYDEDETYARKLLMVKGEYIDSLDEHFIYKKGNTIRLAHLGYDDLHSDDVILRNVYGLRSAELVFNDFVDGQFIVVAKSKYKKKQRIHVAIKRADGIIKQKSIFTRKSGVRYPKIHTFSDGTVRLIWKHHKKIYQTIYRAGGDRWSRPKKQSRLQDNKRWMKPYMSGTDIAIGGTKSIDLFQGRLSSNTYFVRWHMGGSKSMDVARLPDGYELVSTASVDFNESAQDLNSESKHRLILLRKGTKIRAIVTSDDKLFGSN